MVVDLVACVFLRIFLFQCLKNLASRASVDTCSCFPVNKKIMSTPLTLLCPQPCMASTRPQVTTGLSVPISWSHSPQVSGSLGLRDCISSLFFRSPQRPSSAGDGDSKQEPVASLQEVEPRSRGSNFLHTQVFEWVSPCSSLLMSKKRLIRNEKAYVCV